MNLNGQLKRAGAGVCEISEVNKLLSDTGIYRRQTWLSTTRIKVLEAGDISYAQYLQNLTLSNNIHSEHIDNLYNFNRVVISIEAISGKKLIIQKLK